MITSFRLRRIALVVSLFAVPAAIVGCAAEEPADDAGQDESEVLGLIGNYNTPDPGNRWLKRVNVANLSKGEESRLPDEDQMFDGLVDRIKLFQSKLVEAHVNESVIRAFHAKPHACVQAEFQVQVPDNLPRAKVGLFANNARYPMWLRLSNGVAYFQADKKVDVRGVAIKVMNVPGRKLNPGQEDAGTQDFIMIATPTSFTTDAVSLIDFVEVTVKARLEQQAAGEFAQTILRSMPDFVPRDQIADRFGTWASIGGPAGYLVKPGNERLLGFLLSKLVPTTFKYGSLLGPRFWSQGAMAMGLEEGSSSSSPLTAKAKEAVKMAVDPGVVVDFPLPGDQRMPDGKYCHSKGIELPRVSDENYLHNDLASRMNERETCMVVKMQFQENPKTQLIEDTTVEWMERDSPFHTVGFIRIPKMDIDAPSLAEEKRFCNNLAFTPWHAREDHRPLGNFQRARLKVYNALAKTRGAMENTEGMLIEPKGDEFPAHR
jgi:hypothetical protein